MTFATGMRIPWEWHKSQTNCGNLNGNGTQPAWEWECSFHVTGVYSKVNITVVSLLYVWCRRSEFFTAQCYAMAVNATTYA